jgi:hypothetical protein
MKLFVSSIAFVLCSSITDQALAGSYSLSDSVVGPDFLDAFTFQTIADPSNGTVFVFVYLGAMFPVVDVFFLLNPVIMLMRAPPRAKVLCHTPTIVLPYVQTTRRSCPQMVLGEILSESNPTRTIPPTSPCMLSSPLQMCSSSIMFNATSFDINYMPTACG